MANEEKKNFNAMLSNDRDMPKIKSLTTRKSLNAMATRVCVLRRPRVYDVIMKLVPFGRVVIISRIRQ